jgi:transcriptional regulator of acetoin/glycerol metabolism
LLCGTPFRPNWNVSGAARALGMERTNLHKRIGALGLSRGK